MLPCSPPNECTMSRLIAHASATRAARMPPPIDASRCQEAANAISISSVQVPISRFTPHGRNRSTAETFSCGPGAPGFIAR
jgi:hypothetical protein